MLSRHPAEDLPLEDVAAGCCWRPRAADVRLTGLRFFSIRHDDLSPYSTAASSVPIDRNLGAMKRAAIQKPRHRVRDDFGDRRVAARQQHLNKSDGDAHGEAQRHHAPSSCRRPGHGDEKTQGTNSTMLARNSKTVEVVLKLVPVNSLTHLAITKTMLVAFDVSEAGSQTIRPSAMR